MVAVIVGIFILLVFLASIFAVINHSKNNKELIVNSLEEDGDLQWISWLTKSAYEYGNDTECVSRLLKTKLHYAR